MLIQCAKSLSAIIIICANSYIVRDNDSYSYVSPFIAIITSNKC